MEDGMKKKSVTGHNDFYGLVTNMEHEIRTQRNRHPRTKVWKDLLKMVDELWEIQRDWAERVPE
jgi:hypothetical protein